MLLRPYKWVIGNTNESIVVPTGFVTDHASIPRPFWTFLSPKGRYARAAIIHDYLYYSQQCSRAQADNLISIAMKESGVNIVEQTAIDWGLYWGGRLGWEENRRSKEAGFPRVVPSDHLNLDSTTDWPTLQERLKAGAPIVTNNGLPPRFCKLGDSPTVPN